MQIIKDFLYTILSLQERFLRLRLNRTLGVKHFSKRKQHYAQGCTLDINSLAETERQELEDKLKNILRTYEYEPKQILKYIQSQGTDVKILKDAKQILYPIGENEGFIYPYTGSKALYLSLSVYKKFALKTNEFFILSDGEINKYYFIYNFYNWFAFKNGISGMDRESQELLKKYLFTDSDTKELQLEEIFKLKDAIKQDKASIEFVIKLCRDYDGAKQALGKMKQEGSAKL